MLGAGRTFCSPPTLAASVSACCLSVGISVSICIYLCRNLCKSLSVSSSVFQNLTSVSQLPCLPTSAQVFIPIHPTLAHPSPRYDSFTLTKGSSANTKMMKDYVLLLTSYLLLCVMSPSSSSSTQHIFVSEAGSQLTTRVEPSPGYTCVCECVFSWRVCIQPLQKVLEHTPHAGTFSPVHREWHGSLWHCLGASFQRLVVVASDAGLVRIPVG